MRKSRAPLKPPVLQRPAGAPRGARLVVVDRVGISVRGELQQGGLRLAQLTWDSRGRLTWEKPFDGNGRAHGLERELREDGSVSWQVPWSRGAMHGLARQFDESDRCIMRSRFVRGRGVDVFCDVLDGVIAIAELREMDETLHGLERWGPPDRPYEEGHHEHGKRHGVFRLWRSGVLEGDGPRYFVNDVQTSRDAYRRQRRTMPDLPPDRRRDDRPARSLPRCLTDGSVWIRRSGKPRARVPR